MTNKFFAQDELNQLYKEMKTIPYSQKSEWQKYLSNQTSKERKKNKRKNEVERTTEYIDYY